MKSNRPQLQTPSSSATAKWKRYQIKNYLHFDTPLNIRRVKKLIQDPNWIQSHAFLPFINFDIVFNKYISKELNEIRPEDRLSNNFKIKEEKSRVEVLCMLLISTNSFINAAASH